MGYGDPVDFEIEKVQTFYTRSVFTIDTIANFDEIVLIMDYDDGFVAFINGVEIARVNMGKIGSLTTYNQLADRSHERELYRENTQPVAGFYIDKEFIKNHFVVGENILSIEFHNDSINGSDLGGIGALYDATGDTYNVFDFFSRYKRCVELDSTKLPIIVIESDEYGIPYKRIEVPATIKIINKGDGFYNKPSDAYELFSDIKIEQRGESSASYPKKSYDFELKDIDYNDTSISLLGMPREADWILQGPFADRSQIRNALIYELGLKTGRWNPRVKFCEVIFNGQYVGLYNLMEKIKRDSSRVNIAKLREEEISGTDLTGGYIIKYDKNSGRAIIVYPKESDIQTEQEEYIRGFLEEYKSVLNSPQGLKDEIGYKKYIDTESLIDYTIISELGKNCDAYLYSTYFYKDKDDRDSRIHFGPLWDFDLSFGNSIWQNGYKTDGWQFEYPGSNKFDHKRLFEDAVLVESFQNRWKELRKSFLHTDSLFARIDELVAELNKPLERNYRVWPVVDKGLYFPYYVVPNYEEEIIYIKDWITERTNWIDNNINNIYYEETIFEGVDDNNAQGIVDLTANIYPNPVHNEFFVDLSLPQSGELEMELINIQGQIVDVIVHTQVEKGDYKVYYNAKNINFKSGLYLVGVKLDGKLYSHVKILKE